MIGTSISGIGSLAGAVFLSEHRNGERMLMLYFSATGNSKYIAEMFCREMDAICHSIEEEIDFDALISKEETVGFCYPVFGSRIPRLLREFITAHIQPLQH